VRLKVDVALLKRGLAATFAAVLGPPAPGNVLLLVAGGKAQHLAIVTGGGRMVHCWGRGPARVIEVPIDRRWPIDSVWAWRSVDG
jgi:hypothetical protein